MENLAKRLKRMASGRNVIIFFIVQMIFQVVIVMGTGAQIEKYGGGPILDLRLHYSFSEVENFFSVLGDSGKNLYFINQVIDMGFVVVYGLAYTLLLIYLIKKVFGQKSWLQRIKFAPLLLALIDILENLSIFNMIFNYPKISSTIVFISGMLTFVKHVLTILILITIFSILFIWMKKNLSTFIKYE